MAGPQYALLRFEKHQGNPAKQIEDHHERQKEQYASNPDVDTNRSRYNFHIIKPQGRYYAEIQQRIEAAGCRTRKDSVRFVDTLVTASPEFFSGKSRAELKEFFTAAADFLTARIGRENFISAVVHMDEKTPHMHLVFVPLTEDRRLCAKEIIGNRKKLVAWQDDFWEYMSAKYPDLERGESAGETGRRHIPTRVFKEMAHLSKQRAALDELLAGINPLNAKSRAADISSLLDSFIPAAEKMSTQLKKYRTAFQDMSEENRELAAENAQLAEKNRESAIRKLEELKLQRDYADVLGVLERIPPEILEQFTKTPVNKTHEGRGK